VAWLAGHYIVNICCDHFYKRDGSQYVAWPAHFWNRHPSLVIDRWVYAKNRTLKNIAGIPGQI
jgi:hypothetical protein